VLDRRVADVANADSLSNRFRSRRFAAFAELVDAVPNRPVRILDVGGTSEFWRQRGWDGRDDVEITLANLEGVNAEDSAPFEHATADATDLAPLKERGFDVVFSNSTIEHLFSWHGQAAMAAAVRDLAPRYWVQTPNHWFPVEPHFLTPGWQYLPRRARYELIQRRRFGHRGPARDASHARSLVDEIRLLTPREMQLLFPDAEIVHERIGPVTKSLIAIRR
jgi:hypothetical protein